MRGTQALPGVAVEVLVEQDILAPRGISLELSHWAEDGTMSLIVGQEQSQQPSFDLVGHFAEIGLPPRPGRQFYRERVAELPNANAATIRARES